MNRDIIIINKQKCANYLECSKGLKIKTDCIDKHIDKLDFSNVVNLSLIRDMYPNQSIVVVTTINDEYVNIYNYYDPKNPKYVNLYMTPQYDVIPMLPERTIADTILSFDAMFGQILDKLKQKILMMIDDDETQQQFKINVNMIVAYLLSKHSKWATTFYDYVKQSEMFSTAIIEYVKSPILNENVRDFCNKIISDVNLTPLLLFLKELHNGDTFDSGDHVINLFLFVGEIFTFARLLKKSRSVPMTNNTDIIGDIKRLIGSVKYEKIVTGYKSMTDNTKEFTKHLIYECLENTENDKFYAHKIYADKSHFLACLKFVVNYISTDTGLKDKIYNCYILFILNKKIKIYKKQKRQQPDNMCFDIMYKSNKQYLYLVDFCVDLAWFIHLYVTTYESKNNCSVNDILIYANIFNLIDTRASFYVNKNTIYKNLNYLLNNGETQANATHVDIINNVQLVKINNDIINGSKALNYKNEPFADCGFSGILNIVAMVICIDPNDPFDTSIIKNARVKEFFDNINNFENLHAQLVSNNIAIKTTWSQILVHELNCKLDIDYDILTEKSNILTVLSTIFFDNPDIKTFPSKWFDVSVIDEVLTISYVFNANNIIVSFGTHHTSISNEIIKYTSEIQVVADNTIGKVSQNIVSPMSMFILANKMTSLNLTRSSSQSQIFDNTDYLLDIKYNLVCFPNTTIININKLYTHYFSTIKNMIEIVPQELYVNIDKTKQLILDKIAKMRWFITQVQDKTLGGGYIDKLTIQQKMYKQQYLDTGNLKYKHKYKSLKHFISKL